MLEDSRELMRVTGTAKHLVDSRLVDTTVLIRMGVVAMLCIRKGEGCV